MSVSILGKSSNYSIYFPIKLKESCMHAYISSKLFSYYLNGPAWSIAQWPRVVHNSIYLRRFRKERGFLGDNKFTHYYWWSLEGNCELQFHLVLSVLFVFLLYWFTGRSNPLHQYPSPTATAVQKKVTTLTMKRNVLIVLPSPKPNYIAKL